MLKVLRTFLMLLIVSFSTIPLYQVLCLPFPPLPPSSLLVHTTSPIPKHLPLTCHSLSPSHQSNQYMARNMRLVVVWCILSPSLPPSFPHCLLGCINITGSGLCLVTECCCTRIEFTQTEPVHTTRLYYPQHFNCNPSSYKDWSRYNDTYKLHTFTCKHLVYKWGPPQVILLDICVHVIHSVIGL